MDDPVYQIVNQDFSAKSWSRFHGGLDAPFYEDMKFSAHAQAINACLTSGRRVFWIFRTIFGGVGVKGMSLSLRPDGTRQMPGALTIQRRNAFCFPPSCDEEVA